MSTPVNTKGATIDAIEHITTQGDRWDTLAWRYYGNPYAYSVIIEANPDLDISTVLPSGVRVLIPVLTVSTAQAVTSNDSLPPWKRT